MKFWLILTIIFPNFVFATQIHTARIADEKAGFSAIVITIPAIDNNHFSILDITKKIDGDNIRPHWDSSKYSLMINGGYFDADFYPVGYCKINGVIVNKTKVKKLSGFIAINSSGSISILTRKDNLSKYSNIIQSGPFVIDPGGGIGIKSRSGHKAKRTLIGMTKNKSLVIIVTKPILLYDLAFQIKKHLPSVERLLNLDGGPSTALTTSSIDITNNWPVRNYIEKTRNQSK